MDHNIAEVSKNLLEQYSDVLNTVPIFVEGEGDCLFHAFQVFYPQMSGDEFRVKTINELFDDETFEEHVKRIINNDQHSGILTISTLSSVLNREIQSIYPNVNDNDAYFKILNRSFHPRTCDESFINDTSLRIMWSGPEPNDDHIWRTNHFVPLLSTKQYHDSSLRQPATITTQSLGKEDNGIVRQGTHGKYYYNERNGRKYVPHIVQENDVVKLNRFYATNKSDPNLRRMICYTTKNIDTEHLPIFLQYISPTSLIQTPVIMPYGNSTKLSRPFTSTEPSLDTTFNLGRCFVTPHLNCTRHVRQNIERQLIKIQVPEDDRQTLLETIFDLPESLIQAADADEFENRLVDLDIWNTINNNNLDNYPNTTDYHDWFITYEAENFQQHLIAGVRNADGYVNQDGSSPLFYNNDNEAINFALKSDTNWDLKPFSALVVILNKLITAEKNETVRSIHEGGEFELVALYTR
ncbi:unnamed protein product [Didymodactylos carnosus]|uniref:OTU domain-containing protein n=1 Tax=Didymodactylos carnosus TaxID=1234261 RepID=A0A815TH56_9BILA|nr:unnamed protein product [Didymodactylos carnosus]CAF1501959.1 unnamed protein product [Didymodactylos carnosus]CAF3900435.1 unnamed protein product [Didymodactylos carnosus]CAF4363555.1 unnamed protein product [Didymodactylos carnosus]